MWASARSQPAACSCHILTPNRGQKALQQETLACHKGIGQMAALMVKSARAASPVVHGGSQPCTGTDEVVIYYLYCLQYTVHCLQQRMPVIETTVHQVLLTACTAHIMLNCLLLNAYWRCNSIDSRVIFSCFLACIKKSTNTILLNSTINILFDTLKLL